MKRQRPQAGAGPAAEGVETSIRFVAPPVPAPYLRGIPTIPDPVLEDLDGRRRVSPEKRMLAERMVRALLSIIRRRRMQYEREHGVVIIPEPPHDGGLRPGERFLFDLLQGKPPPGLRR